jgi:hypothetical protein
MCVYLVTVSQKFDVGTGRWNNLRLSRVLSTYQSIEYSYYTNLLDYPDCYLRVFPVIYGIATIILGCGISSTYCVSS